MNRFSALWSDLAPWIAAALVALTVSWAADGIREGFEGWMEGEKTAIWLVVSRIVYVLLFMAAATWLYKMRQAFFQPRTRFLRNEAPEKREHLILFLSSLDPHRIPLSNGVPEDITLTGDLDKDLTALVSWKQQVRQYWPWEMPLRGIRYHLGRLSTITIICSRESIEQVHWFDQILKLYSPLQSVLVRTLVHQENEPPALVECAKAVTAQGGWDFERFDELSRAVLHLLRELKKRRVTDNQIMIDFTGGQKVTSIVAAAVTFNRTIKAQYVQTNPPYEVISYDIVLGSSETGGLGL